MFQTSDVQLVVTSLVMRKHGKRGSVEELRQEKFASVIAMCNHFARRSDEHNNQCSVSLHVDGRVVIDSSFTTLHDAAQPQVPFVIGVANALHAEANDVRDLWEEDDDDNDADGETLNHPHYGRIVRACRWLGEQRAMVGGFA